MSDFTTTGPFATRYQARDPLKGIDRDRIEKFFNSAVHAVANEILGPLVSGYDAVKYDVVNVAIHQAHRVTCMELGKVGLFRMTASPYAVVEKDHTDDCCNYLINGRQPPGERFSFLENLLACCWHPLQQRWPRIERQFDGLLKTHAIPLEYGNRIFQPVDASIMEAQIHVPFWELVEDPVWANVRNDLKQALALRDGGGPDPAFYAARALESAIKVISKMNGWTKGKEGGAAAFIDNLVGQANGRFIEVWESEVLKAFFGKVRNPTAHGAGDAQQPKLSSHQTNWAIEFCMTWVKSLIKRM